MGEIADQIIDQIIFESNSLQKTSKGGFQKGVGLGMWRSKTGPISIFSMSTSHIKNAIKVCNQTNNHGKKRELLKELRNRGIEY